MWPHLRHSLTMLRPVYPTCVLVHLFAPSNSATLQITPAMHLFLSYSQPGVWITSSHTICHTCDDKMRPSGFPLHPFGVAVSNVLLATSVPNPVPAFGLCGGSVTTLSPTANRKAMGWLTAAQPHEYAPQDVTPLVKVTPAVKQQPYRRTFVAGRSTIGFTQLVLPNQRRFTERRASAHGQTTYLLFFLSNARTLR